MSVYRTAEKPEDIKIPSLPLKQRLSNIRMPQLKFLNSIPLWLAVGGMPIAFASSFSYDFEKVKSAWIATALITWMIAIKIFTIYHKAEAK